MQGVQAFSEEEIVAGLKQGDRKVLTYLYSRNYPIVKAYVLANSGTSDDARDVFQEGMTAVWNNLFRQQYESREGIGLEGYLLKICRFRWLDRTRSAAFRHSIDLPSAAEPSDKEDSLKEMVRREEIDQASRCMQQLGEKCRRILYLFYYHKKSMEEIAAACNMTPDSTKNQKYRCLKQLKDIYLTANGKK